VSKPYDATVKDLLETAPADWLRFLGRPDAGPVRLIDADLSTVTTQADKLFHVGDPSPWLLHLEFQTSRDVWLPQRMRKYNALAAERHQLPVSSAVVLLRPDADGVELTGLLRERHRLDRRELRFPYTVVRVWQVPVDTLLTGGPGTLPLVPLGDVEPDRLPEVMRRAGDRLKAEVSKPVAEKLWAATYVLMGLRYTEAVSDQVLLGVIAMEESVTYQAILRKGEERGRVKEARRMLLVLGREKFGAPDDAAQATLDAIDDRQRLEELSKRLFGASTWRELLESER
jgi:predicted transposase YdaD